MREIPLGDKRWESIAIGVVAVQYEYIALLHLRFSLLFFSK